MNALRNERRKAHVHVAVERVDEGIAFYSKRFGAGLVEEIGADCCYAKSDTCWVTDPSGVAWETYHTLGSIPMFGGEEPDACCATAPPAQGASGCCAPAVTTAGAALATVVGVLIEVPVMLSVVRLVAAAKG